MREILDTAIDPAVEETVFMKSAQVGWTESLNNLVGFFIHLQPCPILLVQPTLDMAKGHAKEKMAPMIAETPALATLVRDPRSRDSGNTILHKKFAGGHLTITGANSAAGLRSRAIKALLLDEIDAFPADCQGEGDPIKLAEKRTQTYADRIIFKGSTPTVKDGAIDRAYERSDQRRYFVPCPACDHEQVLEFERLVYEAPKFDRESNRHLPGKYDDTAYCCEGCGYLIPHSEKEAMLAGGRWVAERPFTGIAGFWISALYSPWVTWGKIAEERERVKSNEAEYKVFWNTTLARLWGPGVFEVNVDGASDRCDKYEFPVPDEVLLLTAFVDVQDDRFEIEVLGWGLDDETWSIMYEVITADPKRSESWQALKDYLLQEFHGRNGKAFRIAACGIDAGGHHSHEAYKFAAANAGRRWWATRGSNRPGMPIVPLRQSTTEKGRFFWIGTEKAKDWFYSRLNLKDRGPGYCHFPAGYETEYFRQLNSEKAITTLHNGYPVTRYVKVRERNEALDCRVGNIAVCFLLKPNFKELARRAVAALPVKAAPKANSADAASPSAPEDLPPPPPRRARFKPSSGGGFVNSWRK